MSTFFQKLTGTQPPQEESPDAADAEKTVPRAEPPRPPKRPIPAARDERKTRARADAEITTSSAKEESQEEGELTVDIYDTGDAIVIQSTVAGVKPEDLDVTITSDTVTIRGKREREEKTPEENYYYKELFWGVFSRSVILPEEIDEEAAEATLKHGLLAIRLPKKRREMGQKLKVKAL